MNGWIALPRDIFEESAFTSAPMSEREAFIWMVARAAWKDTRHMVCGKLMPVPRGSFFCTIRELQSHFGWKSHKRVQGFLKKLQAGRLIDHQTDTGKSLVTICNYDKFQGSGHKTEPSRKQNSPDRGPTKEEEKNKEDSLAGATEATARLATNGSMLKRIFDQGVIFLVEHGIKEAHARALIGKWRKKHDDASILTALTEADKAGVVDPADKAGVVDPVARIENRLTRISCHSWVYRPDEEECLQ
ncbi:hypothetical protein [Frigidibacter sp. ROC022]|uniref:hypothetical protein n=1 Tax=Frigidibacter sp. ROC022 TaxID=2971796 RepID=UPI00215B3E32|nr:hypothetical protein [Frigidibacter sp. ROC022]MCR8724551.1 hypothetical protein [Frigidibacter sp. ROC022]